MSKHAIDRTTWTPEERTEYESLLGEVVEATTNTTERLDLFERKLDDAINAHRSWASDVDSACRRTGLSKEISRYEGRNRALVAYDGRVLNLPAKQARKVATVDGVVTYQRELIELWSWDDIAAKRHEALTAQRTYSEKVAHYDRLLALRDLAPESATPREAAESLGQSVEEFLARAAA